jgi:putative sigma-54 modulation protein
MHNTITGRHLEITPALKTYVNTKLARLERHHDPATSTQVILSVENLDHKAEAILQLAGETLFAEATAPDMYAAIDVLADRLDRQLLKYKERQTNHHATPAVRLKTET